MKEHKPEINPAVVLRKEFDDWAVLYNPDTAEAVGINPTGVVIWEHLARQRSIPDIIELIRDGYESVPDNVSKEVESFINDLTARGFIGYEMEK